MEGLRARNNIQRSVKGIGTEKITTRMNHILRDGRTANPSDAELHASGLLACPPQHLDSLGIRLVVKGRVVNGWARQAAVLWAIECSTHRLRIHHALDETHGTILRGLGHTRHDAAAHQAIHAACELEAIGEVRGRSTWVTGQGPDFGVLGLQLLVEPVSEDGVGQLRLEVAMVAGPAHHLD